MSSAKAIRIMDKANKKAEREFNKRVREVVKNIEKEIKDAAKQGLYNLRCEIGDEKVYEKAKMHLIANGFTCWCYGTETRYLAIEWLERSK